MATDTHSAPKPRRRAPRWVVGVAGAVVALVALAALVIEVVAPLSAGLPIGWGQYNNARFHLHVGEPPLWNITADGQPYQALPGDCGFVVLATPLNVGVPHSSLDSMKLPRWMALYVAAPCAAQAPANATQQPAWQATGQRVTVAGQSAPLEELTWPDAQQISDVSYAVSVTLHGYQYTFQLQEPSAAQARQDLPDFLTFVQSFRYTS